MGNRKPVEAKKRKKKGRPSLLDLQKRSLRLQKQQEEEEEEEELQQPEKQNGPNPNPNPNRRSTRRNPNLVEDEDEDDEEEEEESNGSRKEKKLKLVSRIPNGSDLAESGPDSDGGEEGTRKKRKIDTVETAGQNSNPIATDQTLPGDPSDSGPTTPLPDKKLLVFILDRLQKKDTYGVFSEPVDPEELPDYHDIIENPMDFGTVRKKLDNGAYENLEQFESDIFLICSNAQQYNSSDTIYFRQAKSIQELAKKDFDNLRQESDDEPEEKTVRRGRPPIKNVMKRIARGPVDRTGSDFSCDASLASSNSTHDLPRKGLSFDKPSIVDASVRSSHAYRGNAEHKSERNEEYSGSPLKGIPMRNWKKFSSMDENRRNTYFHPLQSTCYQEQSIFGAFKREKKLLMPVGLYMEHSYSRSLARFAANLDPVGWAIAAKKIQKVLPPGTKIGPGWVGDAVTTVTTHQFRPPVPPPPLSSPPDSSSQSKLPKSQCTAQSSHEQAPNNSASASPTTSRVVDSSDSAQGMRSKCSLVNGFKPGYGPNLLSHPRKMVTNPRSPEMAKTHIHSIEIDDEKKDGSGKTQLCQTKPTSVLPPDLHADQSVAKQQKQADLALQL